MEGLHSGLLFGPILDKTHPPPRAEVGQVDGTAAHHQAGHSGIFTVQVVNMIVIGVG